MEKKYTVLRVIATLYKIVGVLIALGTILVVILIVAGTAAGTQAMREFGFYNGPLVGFFSIIITILTGGLTALGVYAIGEGLYLLIGLEENTRFTAILLRDRFYPPAQPPQQPMMPPQAPPNPPPANNPPA